MEPVGLIFKDQKIDLHTGMMTGELAIVHRCIYCARMTANRIAGDDNPYPLIQLLKNRAVCEYNHEKLLTIEDRNEVLIVLFGYGYQNNHEVQKLLG